MLLEQETNWRRNNSK